MSAPSPVGPESGGRRLSDAEQRILDDLAGRENAGDPGFVVRMNAPMRPGATDGAGGAGAASAADASAGGTAGGSGAPGWPLRGVPRRDRIVSGLVVGGLLLLVLPAAWALALLLVGILVVGPTILALKALRDGGLEPPSARDRDGRPGSGESS